MIREPADHTESEGALGIHIRLWAGHKYDNYMSFVIRFLIMYHVHPQSTEMELRKPIKYVKAYLKMLTKLLL